MKRAFVAASLVGLIFSPGRSLGAAWQAPAAASANIVEGGGIQVLTPLTLPTVQIPNAAQGSTGATPGELTGNARLTIHGQAGDVLSMAVPDKLTLVRTGGDEALTLDNSAAYGLVGRGVLMGGELINGNAMSVDIGSKLSLASVDHLVPGPYEGLFVVVVQYN
ncbi:MAG: hypothetical protein JWQ97_2991 [Phenylobacterium sp.]|nr:hypothetical protein [Phenylobacterium sp.]